MSGGTGQAGGDPFVGRILEGRYRVEGRLGEGGMAVVYRAVQLAVDRPVAIKVIRPALALDERVVRRFEREARVIARLRSPHVVRLLDVGRVEGRQLFLVMELLEGEALSRRLVREGAQPARRVLWWVEQVARALEEAHAAGVVHRDLKPDNIFVDPVPGDAEFLKVVDFGIAKLGTVTTSRLTSTHGFLGTPRYVAPEQLTDSKQVDGRADLYALGAIAYEALCGEALFGGQPLEVLYKHLHEPPRPLRERAVCADLDPAVEAFVMALLAKEASARPATAREVAQRAAELREGRGTGRGVAILGPGLRMPAAGEDSPAQRGTPREVAQHAPVVRGSRGSGRVVILSGPGLAPPETDEGLPRPRVTGPSVPPARSRRASRTLLPRRPPSAPAARVARGSRASGSPPPDAAEDDAAPSCPEGFVYIRPGSFLMGSSPEEPGRLPDEGPKHRVQLTHAFFLGRTPVTQGEYARLMGVNPSHFKECGEACPVECVTWWDALAYANALSRAHGLRPCYRLHGCRGTPGDGLTCDEVQVLARDENPYLCEGYRLPTEAEWEYAYRAGTTTAFYNGPIVNPQGRDPKLDVIGWYAENSGGRPHAVASKEPNAWGLYDMAGNVWEWCWDWYLEAYYAYSALVDPMGPDEGTKRVTRGGSWANAAGYARAAYRDHEHPGRRYVNLGFRLARTVKP